MTPPPLEKISLPPALNFLTVKKRKLIQTKNTNKCLEKKFARTHSRCSAPISTACHLTPLHVENSWGRSAYFRGFRCCNSTKLKNYKKNPLKIVLFSTGASALSTGVCSCSAPTTPFYDTKTNKGIIGRDTLRFAACAGHSRGDCLLRSHFSPLALRKTITASLRSLPSGPSTGRSDGCPYDVSLCDTTAW